MRGYYMKEFKDEHCAFCSELKVNVHKLQNGNYGVWCDNCMIGIPTRGIHARLNRQDAINDYKFLIGIALGNV